MKSRASKNKKVNPVIPEEDIRYDERPVTEDDGSSSISEFIKIKKLQNQILEKLLENITNPESSEKNKNRKNK
jgi:hypothetical protein